MTGGCIAGVDMPELLPCGYLVGDSTNIAISLKGLNVEQHFVSILLSCVRYVCVTLGYCSIRKAYSNHQRSGRFKKNKDYTVSPVTQVPNAVNLYGTTVVHEYLYNLDAFLTV